MEITYDAASPPITLTAADQFVLNFMLGLVGQGHGHVRVRNSVSAIKYIRLQYNLGLVEARDLVFAYYDIELAKQNIS